VWKFGDQINTDLIQPSTVFRLPQEEQHRSCFEAIRPGWVDLVQPGDLIIAGDNFGIGSGRPIGSVLRACGIAGLAANSINGLALRNCLNFSLPALNCPGISAIFREGETARIDYLAGAVENVTRNIMIKTAPLAEELAAIVLAGGLVEMLVEGGYIEKHHFVAATR
jgi:3-isopropylmalate/(R)-2-methylmalate dehydratase small subunit